MTLEEAGVVVDGFSDEDDVDDGANGVDDGAVDDGEEGIEISGGVDVDCMVDKEEVGKDDDGDGDDAIEFQLALQNEKF